MEECDRWVEIDWINSDREFKEMRFGTPADDWEKLWSWPAICEKIGRIPLHNWRTARNLPISGKIIDIEWKKE